MSFCSPVEFEFLPYYNRSSLLVPAKLNSSFGAVSLKALDKMSCAVQFGTFPNQTASPYILFQLWGTGAQIGSYLFVRHLLSLFGIAWGWGSWGRRAISLRGFITFDTLNVWFCLPCSHSSTACTSRDTAKKNFNHLDLIFIPYLASKDPE